MFTRCLFDLFNSCHSSALDPGPVCGLRGRLTTFVMASQLERPAMPLNDHFVGSIAAAIAFSPASAPIANPTSADVGTAASRGLMRTKRPP
jgi:hypothetical protein